MTDDAIDVQVEEHLREQVYTCYQCGICVGGCPVARVEESFRPRRIMTRTQQSMVSDLIKEDNIWNCAACYNCYEHCPQDVKVTDVIFELQSEAIKKGIIPKKFGMVMGAVYKNGLTGSLVGFQLKKRLKAGLSEPPKVGIEAAQKLMDETGFTARFGIKKGAEKDE